MTRARDLANIADGTFTATDLDLSGTLTVSGDANFDTDTLFVDVSTDRVGIGYTSPNYKLDTYAGSSNSAVAHFSGSTAYTGRGLEIGTFAKGVADGGAYLDAPAATYGALVFKTIGSERMRIDSSGNVGIGTSSPSTALHVDGIVTVDRLINATTSADPWLKGVNGSGTETSFVKQDGSAYFASNVGIGTSSPSVALDVYRNASNASEIRVRNDNDGTLQLYTASASSVIGTVGATPLLFRTDATERMRLDSNGHLILGRSSATAPNTDSGSNFYGSGEWYNYGGAGQRVRFYDTSTGGIVGTITTTTSATAYNTSSDARLKENIAEAESASSLVDAIKVRQFDWIADGSHQRYGMVAQELLEVAPEAVHQPEDPEDMMGVDYSKLVPMLVKEIQSLRARVAQLEGA